MWSMFTQVTTGLTLAAFIVAVSAKLYQSSLQQRERLIRMAPESERPPLIDKALEEFRVETPGLTKLQKYQLAVEQIKARERRFKAVTRVVLFVALLLGGISIFAISRMAN